MADRTSTPLTASGPPLDYSFKELRSCAELEQEEPRSGTKRVIPEAKDGGDPAAAAGATDASAVDASAISAGTGGATNATLLGASSNGGVKAIAAPGSIKPRCVIRKVTTSVKLNNNMLESVTGLAQTLEFVVNSPTITLQWLDLSFNQLLTIEPELLGFINLKALYLHGNHIRSLGAVERLRKMKKLMSLTLNGNPVESSKIYRPYIVGAVPQLRSLDHATITEDEMQSAAAWFKSHLWREQQRKERLQDQAAASMEG